LFRAGAIDAMLVICPASVRSVWVSDDAVLGEFVKWVWPDVPYDLREYHAKTKLPYADGKLLTVVSNPEFIRRPERLEPLLKWCAGRRAMLVVDESWQFQNYKSAQTKALVKLGKVCKRVYLLNGTPGSPEQVYSQLQILPVDIFQTRNYWTWRARYCVLGGFQGKAITGYTNIDDFNARTVPYVRRRLTRDCLDLPPVSYTQLDARLTPETWSHYKAMRDDLVTWLSKNEVCTAEQAGVRVMRLAQITAGFLGGVQALDEQMELGAVPPEPTRPIGREKLDTLIDWLGRHFPENGKLVVWGRFRKEIERTADELAIVAPKLLTLVHTSNLRVRKLYGGQHALERDEIKHLMAPGGDPAASILVGTPQAGSSGLNFAAAHTAIYMTNSFSAKDRAQSEGRLNRPGQTRPVLYVDIAACGPDGQRTIDHHIIATLRRKQDLSDLTASAWRAILTEE
jgi:hypothetical protein